MPDLAPDHVPKIGQPPVRAPETMSLIMTLLVRDEQDIIHTNLEYHLAQGVDHFIVTDNRSSDRTLAILDDYVERGLVTLIHEPSDDFSQDLWVTRMARGAYARDPEAWVIHSDADEFWWPGLGRTLDRYLATVPRSVLALEAPRRNYVPLAEEPSEPTEFWRCMQWRESRSLNNLGQPLPPKTFHRAHAVVEVAQGNHAVTLDGELVEPHKSEIEILHFPMRGVGQYRNKIARGGAAYSRNTRLPPAIGLTWRKAYAELVEGRLEKAYRAQTFDPARIESGLENGSLVHAPQLAHFLEARRGSSSRSRPCYRTQTTRGIVALADENYFPGVRMLYHSAQASYPIDFQLYDLGISEMQREEARRTMPRLRVVPIPSDSVIEDVRKDLNGPPLLKANKRVWPLWICPFLIAASPFRYTIWADADMLVLRDLGRLFELLIERPVFTPENLAPGHTANPPELYELLGPDLPSSQPLVNAGLSGWDLVRDHDLLQDYCDAVRSALARPDVRDAIAWHDQGCLIWALVNQGCTDLVVESTTWNQCVAGTPLKDWSFEWSAEALDYARSRVPNAAILHWNGVPVPWRPPAEKTSA